MREQKIQNVTWIAINRPDQAALTKLQERFPQLHPLVLESLRSPTVRPSHVEDYDHHLYMVLHFPNFLEGLKQTVFSEIDCIILPDTLITVQYDGIELLDKTWFDLAVEKTLSVQYGRSPVHLISYILQRFFYFSLSELDQIQETIDEIEERVFGGSEKKIMQDISVLRRNVLDFRKVIKPQRFTLESFILKIQNLYHDGKMHTVLNDLLGEYMKVWDLLENHKEALDVLYETTEALLVSKTNETIRVITVLAFITFIPTLIANIYGMNILLPFSNYPYIFFVVVGLMVAATFIVYFLLKWRKIV